MGYAKKAADAIENFYYKFICTEEHRKLKELGQALKGNDMTMWSLARWVRAELGAAGVPAVIKFLKHRNPDVRRNAVQVLGWIGDENAVPALIDALDKKDRGMTYLVTQALKKFKDRRAVMPLIGLLKNKDEYIVEDAVSTLACLGDSRAVPALVGLLNDTSWRKRRFVPWALGQSKDPRVVMPLIKALKNSIEDEDVPQGSVITALIDLGGLSVPSLMQLLKDKNFHLRESSTKMLKEIEEKNPGSVKLEDIRESLKEYVARDDNTSARREAAEHYTKIAETVRQGREKIGMPGELLPDKPKPPSGKTFRMRVAHV